MYWRNKNTSSVVLGNARDNLRPYPVPSTYKQLSNQIAALAVTVSSTLNHSRRTAYYLKNRSTRNEFNNSNLISNAGIKPAKEWGVSFQAVYFSSPNSNQKKSTENTTNQPEFSLNCFQYYGRKYRTLTLPSWCSTAAEGKIDQSKETARSDLPNTRKRHWTKKTATHCAVHMKKQNQAKKTATSLCRTIRSRETNQTKKTATTPLRRNMKRH